MNFTKELILKKKNIGLGKRKQAIARVFLIPGEGNLIINKIAGDKYLQYNDTYLNTVWLPLQKLNSSAKSPIIDMFPLVYNLDMINKTQLYKDKWYLLKLNIHPEYSCHLAARRKSNHIVYYVDHSEI